MHTLIDLWSRSEARAPQQLALIGPDERLTFAAAGDAIRALADQLAQLGVGSGSKVCLFFAASPSFVVALFAVSSLGAVACPMNPVLKRRELDQLLDLLEPDLAIVDRPDAVAYRGLRERVPTVGFGPAGYDRLEQSGIAARTDDPELGSVACILCTSGTTGLPKAGMLTHTNLLSNVASLEVNKRWLAEERFANALPAFHVYGITVLTLLPLSMGASVTFIPRFKPENCLRAIEQEQVTRFGGVPSMFTLLNKYAERSPFDHSSCRSWISGGAPLPRPVADEFEALYGGKIYEGYGMLETAPGISWNLDDEAFHPGAVGRPMQGVEVRILTADRTPVAVGETGDILVRSPGVMKGYYRNPDATRETIQDGWLHTGDRGRFDEDGYLYLMGRTKELIIVGANNVYPREIEAVLLEDPAVADAGVAAKSDPLRGEEIHAFVVLEGDHSLDERALKNRCREALAGFKVPRKIHSIAAIPRNASGKIVRKELIETVDSGQ